ncbi:MAG: DNA polymerase III subunit alpha [Candidatus Nealsonbacteria bacterium CG23_combo_of_CG06-09_8_20_14_all_39_17]|uniref:DNA polymerase III subunit alpha n=1 Tax=Candidatus Nealsonbacteria bacterium CG23_combo_of_CG06-09_8_20_14_all_39_17 TaxID=1974722 RepID=A0A2G9YVJ5_9BACT|nr:MAG: DNA polymerase III subunit alpha [Candidatus Nealsonbacteria bacterium CG23_combo_of_CG06-09_8_20_14_all_39_17]
MNKKFTHLHVHSHYSLLDGLPKIDQLLDYAKKLGMDSVALTDHGNIYGAVEFCKKAKERGIKPIIGCEVYVAFESMRQERPNIDDKRYHLILLAKNEKGYKNLVKIITQSHLKGFYYKPRVDEELLSQYSEGLIALSACIQGKIPRMIINNKMDEAEKTALKYQEIFGKENFYLELQKHKNLDGQEKANEGLIALSKRLDIPLVATNDVHYLKPEDAEVQDVLMLINTGANLNDPERRTLIKDDFSFRTPEQMAEDFKETPEAIENTGKIAEACNFEFKLGEIKLPKFEVPSGKTPDEYLRELCLEGVEKRYPEGDRSKILERMEYELSAIQKMGLASYFLIVQDFVNWAKKNRIVVGPGRGSAAGSLVSFLVNITNVDPLKYNLLFERFLNPGRAEGLPDIDLDFNDRRRNEVIEYVSEKYGRDKVAQIITFGTIAARAGIRDVGRVLGYEYSYCDVVAKMIPFGLDLEKTLASVTKFRELYEGNQKARKLIDLAKRLEGVVRHASTHACGVVISNQPLDEIIPLQHPTQNDKIIVTQYEMHAVADLGLLKMDFLGLKNLTIIEDTLSRIYKVQGKNIDLENIPLDDEKTYRLLQRGLTVGVFQLESEGMRKYLKQLKPSNIEDIIAMVALYRPGPMALIPEYIAGKHGQKDLTYFHPKLKPILESTYSIPVYQEQIMKIAQDLAGFSMPEADVLRKAIGKKIEKLLMEQKKKFVDGMKKNSINESVALKIWHWIEPFAHYSFNRSHATCYAMIAYQTAYLKAHFTTEFTASLLTSERNDTERIGFLISEAKSMGIEVLPPDINESLQNFTVVPPKQIRFGLLAIKNVGENIMETVIQERKSSGPYNSVFDFVDRVSARSKDLNKKSLESLIKAGAFEKFGERGQLLHNVERLLEYGRENKKMKSNGQKSLFGAMESEKKNNTEFRLDKIEPISEHEKLKWEKELLGLFVTAHPLDGFQDILLKYTTPLSKIKNYIGGTKVKVGGVIGAIKKIITKTGKPMLFLNIEDADGKLEIVVFPKIMEKNPQLFQENKIVIIVGSVDFRGDSPKVICDEARELTKKP